VGDDRDTAAGTVVGVQVLRDVSRDGCSAVSLREEHLIMTHDIRHTCPTCLWFEHFEKRPDEPSNMGCTQIDWAGYIRDPESPPCGGQGWSGRRKEEVTA